MFLQFIANHRRDARAQKRGGRVSFVSLQEESVDEEHLCVAFADVSAERSFERQWAMTLLEQVINRLREEYRKTGKEFDALQIFLTGDKQAGRYGEVAARLQTTEAALKMAVSRMRRRYGELLRAEIESTVSTREEADDEMRALLAALS